MLLEFGVGPGSVLIHSWIVQASRGQLPPAYPLDGVDEAKVVTWICANHQYDVIGDPCMGQGLIGKNAYLSSRTFVGTD